MSSTATLIAEAKAALAAADAAEEREIDARQLASDARWKAAECMAGLSDGGMGHREIAAAVGVSRKTVDYYVSCWRKGGHARAQVFTDVLREVRGGWGHAPASIDGKVKLAVEYIRDDEVYSHPQVQAARLEAAAARNQAINEQHEVRVEQIREAVREHERMTRQPAGLLAVDERQRAWYWRQFRFKLDDCRDAIDKAVTEMRRTGVPDGGGELVRALRQLAKSLAKAEEVLTESAIGKPETNVS